MEVEKINNAELSVKEYQSQRVVTFKDIDTVHGRPDGTARKRFNDNKKHFIEGEDFFKTTCAEVRPFFGQTPPNGFNPNADIVLLTESGYLMLVKSFTDDLAWDVQRQLVKSYFRKEKKHDVKVLTVTSRDVCKMLGRRSQTHGVILREIRECIAELEEMGFNRLDFFMDSTYPTSHSGMQPQFNCTERGCEYFSWRLGPVERKAFIAEFKDRFRRMQGVLDNKPVRDVVRLGARPEGGTVFRLYKNNQWGILVIDDEVYNLTPEEMTFVAEMIPALSKKGIRQIKAVVQAYLEHSRKGGKLEKIGEYHCLNEEITEIPVLQETATSANPRRLKVDEARSLNEVVNLSMEDAKTRYRMGRTGLLEIANKTGAIVSGGGAGKRILLDRKKLDDYFQNISY